MPKELGLEELSAKASPGKWSIGSGPLGREIEIFGRMRMNASPILASMEHEPREANAEFIVALVNAYRSGLLLPLSGMGKGMGAPADADRAGHEQSPSVSAASAVAIVSRGSLAPGCCSAVSPCRHQQADPTTLCDICEASHERYAASVRDSRVRNSELVAYLHRQWSWARETFGPALRTKGIVQHITKELREIEAQPHDLAEWVDVIILAMDGFWRHGGKPEDLLPAMQAKQDKNFARSWPDWRTMGEDQAIEHDRSDEALGDRSGVAGETEGDRHD